VTPLARSYAQALLQSAPDGWRVGPFLEGAQVVLRAIDSDRRLKAFFSTPGVAAGAKERALELLARRAGLDDFGIRFLVVVLGKRRISHLREIVAGVSETFDEQEGVVAARVAVASPIDDEERGRLEAALSRRVGRTVRMQVDVDPKVLAGFVARVGSNMFDASAVQEIERFRSRAREKAGD
jgi:F-type H+-transporting ATPase subunit delta